MQFSADFYNLFDSYFIKDLGKKSLSLGMVDGPCGAILYFYNKYRVFGDKNDLKILVGYLDNVIEVLNSSFDLSPKYSNGIAGIGWVFKHLSKDGIIPQEESRLIIDHINSLLLPELAVYCQNSNIDFFEGATGIINYLIESCDSEDAVRPYLKTLMEARQNSKFGSIWANIMPGEGGSTHQLFNLGAPHGMVGIILILLKVKKRGHWVVDTLLQDTVKILCDIGQSKLSESYAFPCWFDLSDYSHVGSGLAWCYGDLVTGYCILLAADRSDDANLREFALRLLDTTLDRQYSVRKELNLCHGLISISLLYFRVYKISSELRFKEAYEFWRGEVTKQLTDLLKEDSGYGPGIGILQHSSLMFGLAGTLLGLLTVEDRDVSDWQGAILL